MVHHSSYYALNALNMILFLLTVLIIERFDIALKCFQFKMWKNGDNTNLTMVIALNTVSANQAYKKIVSQIKQMLEKVLS